MAKNSDICYRLLYHFPYFSDDRVKPVNQNIQLTGGVCISRIRGISEVSETHTRALHITHQGCEQFLQGGAGVRRVVVVVHKVFAVKIVSRFFFSLFGYGGNVFYASSPAFTKEEPFDTSDDRHFFVQPENPVGWFLQSAVSLQLGEDFEVEAELLGRHRI